MVSGQERLISIISGSTFSWGVFSAWEAQITACPLVTEHSWIWNGGFTSPWCKLSSNSLEPQVRHVSPANSINSIQRVNHNDQQSPVPKRLSTNAVPWQTWKWRIVYILKLLTLSLLIKFRVFLLDWDRFRGCSGHTNTFLLDVCHSSTAQVQTPCNVMKYPRFERSWIALIAKRQLLA